MNRNLTGIRHAFLNNREFVFAFAAVFVISCFPLFQNVVIAGDDLPYHLLRIESIKEGILAGYLPVKINPVFFNGYGYGSSLFYPDLFLYIPAFFRIIGMGIAASYNLFIMITAAAGFCTAYYCGYGISKNKIAAAVVAVLFSLSQYHLQNMYTRAALGEIQAYMFMPLIVYGFYDLAYGKFEKPLLLIAGFAGLMYCHILSLEITLVLFIVLFLIHIKKIAAQPGQLKKLLICAAVTLGLTCSFWAPFLEQTVSGTFLFQTAAADASGMAVSLKTIFSNSYELLLNKCSFGLLIPALCALRFFLIGPKCGKTEKRIIDLCLITGFALLFAASDLFPWRWMPVALQSIQFPWRLYAYASLFLSAAVGLMFYTVIPKRFQTMALVLLIALAGSFAVYINVNTTVERREIPNGYYLTVGNTYPNNGFEYFPSGISPDEFMQASRTPGVIADGLQYLSYTQDGLRIEAQYGVPSGYIDFPLLYYKGYTAVLEEDGGGTRPLEILGGDSGTVRVFTNNISAHGTMIVDYTGTLVQKLAYKANLAFLALLALYVLVKKTRQKRKNNSDR